MSAFLHLAQRQTAGDIVFLTVLLFFAGMMAKRAGARNDLPPPQFVLVIFGLLNAIAGIFLITAAKSLTKESFANQLGSLMLNEGFVLFPILGVGAFFFPKLLGGAKPEPSDLRIATALWIKRAAIAALTALVIWSSFVLEALGWIRTAALVRGLTTLTYFVMQGHLLEKPSGPPFLAHCFRLGALLLVTGLFLPLMLPGYRLASLHLTFIGGFSVILFTVSTRVIIGHAGQSHLFRKRLRVPCRGSHAASHRNDCPGRRRFHSARAQQSPCLCRADLASCGYCLVSGARAEIVSERRVNRAFLARRFAGES